MPYHNGMEDSDLIRAAIAASGLSARQYAERVMIRDERTIRRWSSGVSPIPNIVRAVLLAQVAESGRTVI